MDEWRSDLLGDLVSFEYGSPLGSEERTGDGFPVFGSNGVVGHHAVALVPGPGIVVGRKGSAGALAWSDSDFWPIDTTYWVKPKVTLDLRWVYGALRGCGLERLHSSTGVPGLNRGDAYESRVPVPPLKEQWRIAEILDTIDETIQATERVIAKLNQMHDGLRRSQFAELLQSSGQREVGECFDMILGKMLSPAAKTGTQPARYLANRNVQWGRCRIDDLDEMDFTESERRRFALTPGDILVCEGGEVGRTAIWRGEIVECYFQKAIHRLRTRGEVTPEFMLHFMRHAAELDLFRSHTSQTSIAHLTGEQLARVSIPVPPVAVQRELIDALASVADRVDAEESELVKLRAIRVGLAADLLSGRVRTVTP